jgi:hypothetical protein
MDKTKQQIDAQPTQDSWKGWESQRSNKFCSKNKWRIFRSEWNHHQFEVIHINIKKSDKIIVKEQNPSLKVNSDTNKANKVHIDLREKIIRAIDEQKEEDENTLQRNLEMGHLTLKEKAQVSSAGLNSMEARAEMKT